MAKKSPFSDFLKEVSNVRVGGEDVKFLSTGAPVLDWLISNKFVDGGTPIGRILELYGDPSTGKSLIAYNILAEVQRQGGLAILDDAESAFEPKWASMCGLNVDELFQVSFKDDTGGLRGSSSVQEHVGVVANLLDTARGRFPIIGVMLDSVGALSTVHEQESAFSTRDMMKAQEVKKAMRLLCPKIKQANAVYIACNHQYTNIGGYGAPKVASGGTGIPFHATVRVQLHKNGKLKASNGKVEGVSIRAGCPKNRIAPPEREVALDVKWTHGLVKDSGLFDICLEWGLIEKVSQGWYAFKGSGKKQRRLEFLPEEMLKALVASETSDTL